MKGISVSHGGDIDASSPEFDDMELNPGQGMVVPKGEWHRVDILQPSQIVYATPGPGGEYRPLNSKRDGDDVPKHKKNAS